MAHDDMHDNQKPTRTITLLLTDHELVVLRYLIGDAVSSNRDPLKDIYEMGVEDEDFEPYEALKALDVKVSKAFP